MIALELRFPAKRYHATPWDQQVNEGAIEWPPSPWRLLRALLATGYSTGMWDGDGPPEAARELLQQLSSVLPSYQLPPASTAHSRHYMPLGQMKNGKEDTTLVFDTWARIESGALFVRWDVDLGSQAKHWLKQLVEALPYLGRSESWVEGRLVEDASQLEGSWCEVFEERATDSASGESVRLLAPLPEEDYLNWRSLQLQGELAQLPPLRAGQKPTKAWLKKQTAIEAMFPSGLVACLQQDTASLKRAGWTQPPGSRWVRYLRPAEALSCAPPVIARRKAAPNVTMALLALVPPNGSHGLLPSVNRGLPIAELVHRSLISHAFRIGGHSEVLSGKTVDDQRLDHQHLHAHLLPLDLDADSHLDHLLIWAPMGLDDLAQQAIRALRRTWSKGLAGDLGIKLVSLCNRNELERFAGDAGSRLRQLLGGSQGSRSWISATPFVPPRFIKRNKESVEVQLRRELAFRGLPEPVHAELVDVQTDRARRMRHVIRTRRNGAPPPQDVGLCLRLDFAEPVFGPLLLGYGSHFGLGSFQSLG